jgi:hypothetical protein
MVGAATLRACSAGGALAGQAETLSRMGARQGRVHPCQAPHTAKADKSVFTRFSIPVGQAAMSEDFAGVVCERRWRG